MPRMRIPRPSRDESWKERAACRKLGPALFYSFAPSETASAKGVCETCPVQTECLAYAQGMESVDVRMRAGIWAGTTEQDRRVLARKAAKEMH